MRAHLAVALAIAASACNTSDGSGPRGAPAKGGPTGDVTIRTNKNGTTRVDGAPLKGDPKVCAALKSCCTVPELGLFCGLAQAANKGDCAKSLKEVQQYAKESHTAVPAGCR